MSATAFDDLTPWPAGATATDSAEERHHNQPPLEERIVMEFDEQLTADGLVARVDEIVASAGRAPAVTDQGVAGKVGDLISMARAARKEIEGRRELHNRPLLNAQRSLKGRADAVLAKLDNAVSPLKQGLDRFMAEEARKAAEARRIREEQERAAAEAAKAGTPIEEIAPPPVVEPARIEQPIARGDLGTRVGTRTVWKHEIEVPVAKLPKTILENERVVAAIDQVIAAQIRSGTREIKGVRIWSEQVADVR